MSPAQQAGILCNEMAFCTFLTERYPSNEPCNAKDFVHRFCGVKSRKDIVANHKTGVLWYHLVEEYRMWQRYPELVP